MPKSKQRWDSIEAFTIGNTVRHFSFRKTPRQKAVSFKTCCPLSMPSTKYHALNLKHWSQLRPRTHTAFVSYLQSRCHDRKSEWLDTLHCCINFPRVLYEVSVTRYLMTYVTIYYRHNHIYYAMRWADQPLLKIHSHWEQ